MYSSAQELLKKLHAQSQGQQTVLEEHLIEPTFGKTSRITFRDLALKYYLSGNDAIYRVISRSMEEEYIASFRSACYLYQLCIELKLKHLLNEHIYKQREQDFRRMLMGLTELWHSLCEQIDDEQFSYSLSDHEQRFINAFLRRLGRTRDELEIANRPQDYKHWQGSEGNIFREAEVLKNHMEQVWHFLNK